jgi:hypothetical protein
MIAKAEESYDRCWARVHGNERARLSPPVANWVRSRDVLTTRTVLDLGFYRWGINNVNGTLSVV